MESLPCSPSLSSDQQLALRMAREMPVKERIVHLQAFKYTFHGHQAVTYLVAAGIAPNDLTAVGICQQLLQQGLFKSIYHKDTFLPDNEVYRFPSSVVENNKHKGLTSLTSTGLYKEIAKFGKAAAQPFKDIQTSLNDTFATLGNLSAVTPKLSGTGSGNVSNSLAPRVYNSRLMKSTRRSQSAKLDKQMSTRSEIKQDSVTSLIGELQVLHATLKETGSLIRLDLQQHTALQEHMVGLLRGHQQHNQSLQLLGIIIAASAALSLVTTSSSWPICLLGCIMLGVVVSIVLPNCFDTSVSRIAAAVRGRRPAAAGADAELQQQLGRQSSRDMPTLDTASTEPAATCHGGSHISSDIEDDADDAGSDVGADWYESGPHLEDFDYWPDQPVMVCPDPAVSKQVFQAESQGPCQALPINGKPIPFESDLFRGVIVVYIRHLATTPTQVFKGKKRLTWFALQGQFKQPVSMDSLVYGQDFSHKLSNLPAPWFIDNMLLPLARKISPALRVGSLEQPCFYSPLITASQIVNVSKVGNAPDIMDAKEDTSLVAAELGCKPGEVWSVASRRKHFQSASQRQKCRFSPEYVWTFHLWQEYVDFASYMLNLSYSSYDLTQHLDGQPLQVMVKDVSCSTYLVSMHVWHRNLVRNNPHMYNRQPTRTTRATTESVGDRSTHGSGAAASKPLAAAAGGGGDPTPYSPTNETVSPTQSATAAGEMSLRPLVVSRTNMQQTPAPASKLGPLLSPAIPAASAVGAPRPAAVAAAAHEASSEVSEHWFDAQHSSPQQDSSYGALTSEQYQRRGGTLTSSSLPDTLGSSLLDAAQQQQQARLLQASEAATSVSSSSNHEQQQQLFLNAYQELELRPSGSCNVAEVSSSSSSPSKRQLQTMRSL